MWIILAVPVAHAANIVNSPYVDPGVLSVAWRGDATTDNNSKSQDGAWKQRVLVGYGVTDRIFIGVGGLDERAGGQTPRVDGAEIQTKIEFTKPGAYMVDSGILLDYKKGFGSTPNTASAKLLLAKTIGGFETRINLNGQHDVGGNAGKEFYGGVVGSERYHYTVAFQPGFEVQTQYGTPTQSLSFSSQATQVGPALYGTLFGHFSYELGYLVGTSRNAPDGDAKALLSYNLHL